MRLEDHRRARQRAEEGAKTEATARANAGESTGLAYHINQEHHACQQAGASMVEHAVRCGELLLKAKAQIERGEWEPWLEDNFEASKDTAQVYMKLARNRDEVIDSKTERARFSSIRQALDDIATPREPGGTSLSEDGAGSSESIGKKAMWSPGRAGTARPGEQKEPVIYRGSDLPVEPDELEADLGDGKPVALIIDAADNKETLLQRTKDFLESATRSAWSADHDAHISVVCAPSPQSRETAERTLANEEVLPEEVEKWQARELRGAATADPSVFDIVVKEAGGLKAHGGDDLREEYSEVPPVFRRKDGLPGDELADYLATHHPGLGVRDERGLLELLKRRRRK